ncbi:MAG TPA: hypothetical protein VN937_15855 [Blastocatellia bacterium]|nr:hypothetical protein [Blastocatellia bacterium]
MKCDGFEAVINDLAKSVIMDAAVRDEALSHSASCPRCAMRLADERELTAGLKALAVAQASEAPARVEASLLAAFREQHAALPVSIESRGNRRWLYVAAGIAAVVAIVMLISLTISRTRVSDKAQKAEQAIVTPTAPDLHQQPNAKPIESPITVDQKLAVRKSSAIGAASGRARKPAGGKPEAEPAGDSNVEAEIVTDFFPLINRGTGQLDSGQVVRVELPRSALMSFGLPMNMDRADERIKADVVVGNDGLARAIRFVR